VQAEDEPTLWSWHSSRSEEEYEEAGRMLAARLQDALRAVFFESVTSIQRLLEYFLTSSAS
jgi:hypothetical protein